MDRLLYEMASHFISITTYSFSWIFIQLFQYFQFFLSRFCQFFHWKFFHWFCRIVFVLIHLFFWFLRAKKNYTTKMYNFLDRIITSVMLCNAKRQPFLVFAVRANRTYTNKQRLEYRTYKHNDKWFEWQCIVLRYVNMCVRHTWNFMHRYIWWLYRQP